MTPLLLCAALFHFVGEDAALRPGFHVRNLKHDGMNRTYLLHVPKGYEPAQATPVVLVLHGATMNGSSMAWLSGMQDTGDKHTFITVFPSGTGPGILLTWNAGAFPNALFKNKVDDVGYIGSVLDDVEKAAHVDGKRVFACGMSNGGMMCYRLAAEMSDRIAAIAAVSGTLALETIDSKRPVSVLHFHGTKDILVPFDGPKLDPSAKLFLFKSVEDSLKPFIALAGCAEKGETSELPCKDEKLKIACRRHNGGKDGSEVCLITIEGGGHTWPGRETNPAFLGATALDLNANEVIWEFFRKHPLNR